MSRPSIANIVAAIMLSIAWAYDVYFVCAYQQSLHDALSSPLCGFTVIEFIGVWITPALIVGSLFGQRWVKLAVSLILTIIIIIGIFSVFTAKPDPEQTSDVTGFAIGLGFFTVTLAARIALYLFPLILALSQLKVKRKMNG
jgi:hypothetical protein